MSKPLSKLRRTFFLVLALLTLALAPLAQPVLSALAANEDISGTFEGTATGFSGGEMKVQVTLDKGKITDIKVISNSETQGVGADAAPQLAQDIVKYQSMAIDTVSGASSSTAALKSAVEAALKSAGADVSAYQQAVDTAQDEELTADLVVVGTGGAGTAAALVAAQAGKSVVIVEKNNYVGGNTKLSSGFFAIGSKFQKEKGIDVSVDEAVKQLLEFNHYLSNGPLTRAVVEKSAETVEWLDSLGMEVYLQEGTTQFAHEGDNYKAQSYHKYKDTSAGFDKLYAKLQELGATLKLNTTMEELIEEDGVVKGIVAKKSSGGTLTVRAKATIVATGGYGANQEKIAQVSRHAQLNSLGTPNRGEGLAAMEAKGAVDVDSTPLLHAAQLAESKVAQASSDAHMAGFSSSPLTQLLMSPLLWVDPSGTRFTNEDVVYDTAFWANAAYSIGGKYYFIVDKATLEAYTAGTDMLISKAGPGANMDKGDFVQLADEAVAGGTAFKGETLEELAKSAGMDAKELEASVTRYNQMVEAKSDTDYAKSADSLKYTVKDGPFYAFDTRAVYLGTIGGVRVNEHLQVLNQEGKVIPGLYTGGTNAGGYYEGAGYPPYEGLASGFTWTSGRIAGESILKYLDSLGE